MDPSLGRSIAERAASQLGHITRPQLRELGLSSPAMCRWVRYDRLHRLGDRTYRLAGVPASFEGAVMAACLEIGGVASHRTAAALHRLHGFALPQPPIEVTVRGGTARTTSPLATIHRNTNLGREDIVHLGPIPVTSVARTILGLAALAPVVSAEALADAVDAAVRDGRASDRWLWWRLERLRCRGRPGVTALERVLDDRATNGGTESWLEREYLSCTLGAGLPRPVVQRVVRRNGAFVSRVDFSYEAERLIVEVNGHRSHSTRRQRDADAARGNRLQLLGYRVLQFTYDDVVRRPLEVIATVQQALRLAAA